MKINNLVASQIREKRTRVEKAESSIQGTTEHTGGFQQPHQIEPAAKPAFSGLSTQVFELFERMVGLITIANYSGKEVTTVKLSMPGSMFNGCEVRLERFSTAPNSFNLQLLGNPDAIQAFGKNIDDLAAAFKKSDLDFTVNIKNPELSKEHRYKVEGTESGSEKEEGERGG